MPGNANGDESFEVPVLPRRDLDDRCAVLGCVSSQSFGRDSAAPRYALTRCPESSPRRESGGTARSAELPESGRSILDRKSNRAVAGPTGGSGTRSTSRVVRMTWAVGGVRAGGVRPWARWRHVADRHGATWADQSTRPGPIAGTDRRLRHQRSSNAATVVGYVQRASSRSFETVARLRASSSATRRSASRAASNNPNPNPSADRVGRERRPSLYAEGPLLRASGIRRSGGYFMAGGRLSERRSHPLVAFAI
jgi:hypothetical protein